MQQRGFGDLEAVVMDRVWDHQEAVMVREIFDELSDERRIAYTTVMSTMDNLHRKGWLDRERNGKAYRYWPTMSREERSAKLMRDAFESGGNADLVLTFFLEQMNDDDAARLRAMLKRAGKKQKTP